MLTTSKDKFILSGTFIKGSNINMPIKKGWLTITEAADLMDVSHQTVWNYIRRKKIFKNAYRMPGGRTSPWRIPIEDVLPYVPKDKLAAVTKVKARSGS